MKRTLILLAVIAAMAACSSGLAVYTVSNEGAWPKSWPKELEPLRKQAKTLVGPMIETSHHLIPFTSREQFEAAWPYFLKVKTKGAPIFLVRAPKTDFLEIKPAGILIHSPPVAQPWRAAEPERPIPGQPNARLRWLNTTYFELVVDGKIVDLNRIQLPPDTLIIDERFKAVDHAVKKAPVPAQPAAPAEASRDQNGAPATGAHE
jgi:hypothetical protein